MISRETLKNSSHKRPKSFRLQFCRVQKANPIITVGNEKINQSSKSSIFFFRKSTVKIMPPSISAYMVSKGIVASHMTYSYLAPLLVASSSSSSSPSFTSNHTIDWKEELFAFPELHWWQYILFGSVAMFCVCFAGLCSGLTLGLLSIDQMSLNILLEAGAEREKKYARRLSPILAKHHLLLVTLLLWVCHTITVELRFIAFFMFAVLDPSFELAFLYLFIGGLRTHLRMHIFIHFHV